MKKRKWLIYILLVGLLCASCLILFVWTDPNEYSKNRPLNPGDDYPAYFDSYQIDPANILSDLRSGRKDVFTPSDFNSSEDGLKKMLHPFGTFRWSQEDYLDIAKAHHLYLTGETFENDWKFYSYGGFSFERCRDPMQGFDSADIIFYKKNPDGSFPVTYMIIYPLRAWIESTYTQYEPRWGDKDFSEADVMNGKITADQALLIAEAAGGEAKRQELSNDGCKMNVRYYADEYWRVSYRWINSQLEFKINAHDGSYEITQR